MHALKENEHEKEPLQIDAIMVTEERNRTFYETISFVTSNITVELILATYIMSTFISRLAVQNLNLEKVCRVTKGYGDVICVPLIGKNKNTTEYEVEIQKIISELEAWKVVISAILTIIVLIYMGAWSDRTGNRKLCILLPIVGEFSVNMSNILSTLFFHAVSAETTMVLEALLPGVTGGFWLMVLGIFSYITDITTAETRTFRMGVATICVIGAIPVGMGLSGILLKLTGYYGVFCITAFVNCTIFVYGCKTLSNKTTNSVPKSFKLSDVITLQKEIALVVFQRRVGNTRRKIILILLTISIVYGQDMGEQVIFYLFSRYQLNWDVYKYGIFSTYSTIVNASGSLFSLFVFTRWLGWDDSSLALLSVVGKTVSSIFTVFVSTDWQMFMVPLVAILNTPKYAAVRSMGSKLVPTTEAGKMNSLISLMETLGVFVLNPAYSLLYAATVERFAAAVFVFTAVTTVPVLQMLTWLFKEHRRSLKVNKSQESL